MEPSQLKTFPAAGGESPPFLRGETWTPRTDHESPILLTPPPALPSTDLGLPSPPGPSAQASSPLPSFSFT